MGMEQTRRQAHGTAETVVEERVFSLEERPPTRCWRYPTATSLVISADSTQADPNAEQVPPTSRNNPRGSCF